jgi:hypothetical protein
MSPNRYGVSYPDGAGAWLMLTRCPGLLRLAGRIRLALDVRQPRFCGASCQTSNWRGLGTNAMWPIAYPGNQAWRTVASTLWADLGNQEPGTEHMRQRILGRICPDDQRPLDNALTRNQRVGLTRDGSSTTLDA